MKPLHALLAATLATATLLAPGAARAWWNSDWTQRTTVALKSGGAALTGPVNEAVVPVRLHSGNFDFLAAKPDGSDLRVLAADDKTPLPFVVERFDPVNELALLWVKLPVVAPSPAAEPAPLLRVYAGNAQAPAEAPGAVFGGRPRLVALFTEADGPAIDRVGQLPSAAAVAREPNGLQASSLRLDGTAVSFADAPALQVPAGGAATAQLWLRAEPNAQGTVLRWGPMTLALAAGQVQASIGATPVGSAPLPPDAWAHLALAAGGGQARLVVNGAVVGAPVAVPLPALAGPLTLGEGVRGLADALVLTADDRSADTLRLAAATQGADTGALVTTKETEGDAGGSGGEPGYLGILVKNLTIDAWVVIIILGVMFVVAAWVMWSKTVTVIRTDRGNRAFIERFRAGTPGAELALDEGPLAHSSLARLYRTGAAEIAKRRAASTDRDGVTAAGLNAVRAVLDADLVRENHDLNARMVLLTIAISGGPFLGLLGTVVGVMITFAAIAAAGDVNVNAIAPGIAAALLATVAGLAVAIPALFGYNWLAARIKNISSDMAIFVDEFITRAAELHGRP